MISHSLRYGTDWPWVSEKEGYQNAWRILEEGEGAQVLSAEEKEWVYGKTAVSLFEHQQ